MKHLTLAALLLFTTSAAAIDTDGFGLRLSPEQREYVKNLKNNSGVPCCDDADGFEAEWDYDFLSPSGYKVRMPNGEWSQVPTEAVITPNKLGAARVWAVQIAGKWYARCFLAGDGS